MAKRKKPGRLNLGEMDELTHNPFAQLGRAQESRPKQATPEQEPLHPPDISVLIRIERHKRGGWLTTIRHYQGDLKALLKQLKAALGTGGTIQDGIVKLQGEHGDRTETFLDQLGIRVRKR